MIPRRLPAAWGLGLVLATVVLSATAAPARAETRRLAVIVGSNHGQVGHAPLRYAEQDAAKLSAVLSELGGLAPADVLMLQGPSLAAVREAISEAARRVASWHADRRGSVVLLFYFSGHSDGQVLELGDQSLPFSELRRRLTESGADVRLVILDSCRSGALLALKGGTLGSAFDIRLADDLGSTGEALIASTAANEAALESSEIGASFFSHHLVSGLRGAADLSGDGLVTLGEAYQYAFARTLRATSETFLGPQHAAYDYRLAGRGDLVLTEVRQPSAVLDLPREIDRLLLVAKAPTEQVVAEIGPRSAHRIAVASGEYDLRAWRGSQALAAHVRLERGQELQLSSAAFSVVPAGHAVVKGDTGSLTVQQTLPPPIDLGPPSRWALSAGLGVAGGAARDSTLALARLGLERRLGPGRGAPKWIGFALVAGSGRAIAMRESRVAAEVSPSWGIDLEDLRAGVGLGLGGGMAFERTDAGAGHFSGIGWVSGQAHVELRITRKTGLMLAFELPATLFRREGEMTAAVLPFGWLGLSHGL